MNEQKTVVKSGFGIDLQKLVLAYLRRWWLIILVTVAMAAGSWFYTTRHIAPLYQASMSIYVNSVKVGQNQQIGSISSSALATSQRLVLTYVNMIKSDAVLDKVAEKMGGDVTASDIRRTVSAAQVDETEMFCVTVVHPDPAFAAHTANIVADVALEEIGRVVEGSSAKVVDYAKVPKHPISPNVTENVLLGAVMGGCLSVLFLTLCFLLDVRIKEESDLYALFNLPVLGQIPEFSSADDRSKKKGEKRDPFSTRRGGNGR